MEVDHDLVVVDEFDALAIEVKMSQKLGFSTSTVQTQTSCQSERDPALEVSRLRLKQQLGELKQKLGKYPAKTHARKVASELGAQHGLVYLPGHEEQLYEDSDMGPQFRQRRYFYYLSGANFAGCHVTYDIARDQVVLWIPVVDPKQFLWFGTLPTVEQMKNTSDVDDVRHVSGLERFLHQTMNRGSTLYVLHPDQAPTLQNTKGVVHVDSTVLLPAMNAARVVKTDYEVAMIRRANLVSSAAHRAVFARLRRLTNEREVEAIFRGFCLAHGASQQAYPVISGAGSNAATLHYWKNDAALDGKQLLVLDAGAEWDLYASDITRTVPLSGQFTAEGAAIYRIVDRMQTECIDMIKPGIAWSALHLHACVVAAQELLNLGILQGGTAAEIVRRGTVSAFFPHGLGHHVGLEVHDVEAPGGMALSGKTAAMADWERQRRGRRSGAMGKREWVTSESLAQMYRESMAVGALYKGRHKLAKNMIMTVEPGIYFCRDFIQAFFLDNPLHAKYINASVLENFYLVGGVRIEDCVLVTEVGFEILTTAPKGDEALKIINTGL